MEIKQFDQRAALQLLRTCCQNIIIIIIIIIVVVVVVVVDIDIDH